MIKKTNKMKKNAANVENTDIDDNLVFKDRLEEFERDEEEIPPQKPFDPSKIILLIKQPTLDNLMKRINADPSEIDLKTTFQRKDGLWSDVQKSKLIESLLLRIPLPAFYFDGTDDDKWLIVDGLQRLHAFKDFIAEQSLKLKGLEYLKEYSDYTFDMLPRSMQRRIEETQVTAYIIQPGTPEEVKFNIFKRINTGGLPLSPQEIRHALNQGIPAEFLRELSEEPVFTNALQKVQKDRMEDREIVLRFLAFYIEGYENYTSDLDTFLNTVMRKIGTLPEDKRKLLKELFKVSMERAYKLFEKRPFRKLSLLENGSIRKGPLNKAIFDVWSVILARLSPSDFEKVLQNKDLIINGYIKLLSDDKQFERSVTTGTGGETTVRIRFERINNLVERILKNDK